MTTVTVDRSGDVTTLTIDAPPVNLYSLALHADFDGALDLVEADLPRVLVIRANGKLVSGGVDVAQFHARTSVEETKDLYDRMLELPERINALRIPTVFVAHGLTLTWALEVALACDIILASSKAKFGLVERVIGLTPTMGGTQRIAARAGVARAKEIVFTGDLFSAADFERWNIINRVLDPATLDADVDALVQQIAVGPTKAFGAAKDILDLYEVGGVPVAVAGTTQIAAALYETQDLRHGMESFLENGPGQATFTGS